MRLVVILVLLFATDMATAACPPVCGPEQGKPYVPLAQTAQGVYVEDMTIIEGAQAVVRLATSNATELLTITNYVTSVTVHSETVDSTAQANGFRPWVNAGWARGVTLPALPVGLYLASVPAVSVVPADIVWSTETYAYPFAVIPATPTQDFLVVLSAMQNMAYNTWPNYSRYVGSGSDGKSAYHDPDAAIPSTRVGIKRPGFNNALYDAAKVAIEQIEAIGRTWVVASDEYIEANPAYLDNFTAVVLVEQNEYATYELRQAYDNYVDAGGRLLAFGNEIFLWLFRKNGDAYRIFKSTSDIDPFLRDGNSLNDHLAARESVKTPPDYPETRSLGTSYWLGRSPVDTEFTVYRTAHWLYDGVGLAGGEATGLSDTNTILTGAINLGTLMDGTRAFVQSGLPWVTDHAEFEIPTSTLILATIPTVIATPWPTGGANECVADPVFWWTAACYVPGFIAITILEKGVSNGVVMMFPLKGWLALLDATTGKITRNALRAFAGATIDYADGFAVTPP